MKVFCSIKNQYEGFRELESFNREASENWSKTGQLFPMYDPETMEIFECAFNSETGWIVAYMPVSIEEFRKRLEKQAEALLQERIAEAIRETSEDIAKIHSSIAFAEKMYILGIRKGE